MRSFKRIGSGLAWRSRSALQRVRARLPHRPYPAILMYHRVADECFDPWGLTVEPRRFEEQMAWLAKHRTVMRLAEFAALHRKVELPADAVALTFDDGYACNAEVAAPVLETLGTPATIFLPAALIERGGTFWWDELEDLVFEHHGLSLTLDGEAIPLGPRAASDRRWRPGATPSTQRQKAFVEFHIRLATKRSCELDQAMRQLRDQVGRVSKPDPARRLMTRDQVRTTASPRIEFGSHALTHPRLPYLSEAEQRHEILDSVQQVRALTGSRPATLAYPYGAFDKVSEALAAKAGFDCACTTRDIAVSRRSRPFALPRVTVGNWGATGLERALARVRAE